MTQWVDENCSFLEREGFFFEMTSLAFSYFASQQVDIALIEVGLGGRLDATNIVRPVLSVTNIGMDPHILGDTLRKLQEKAGIIKEKFPWYRSNPAEIDNLYANCSTEKCSILLRISAPAN